MNSTAGSGVTEEEMRYLSIAELDRKCPRGVLQNASDPGSLEAYLTQPFADSCLSALFLKLSAQLRRYTPWEEWLYTLLYALISALALVGNGVVILAVIRKREMRTSRNVLIVNLALSNLMLALTTLPFLWLPSIDFDFPTDSNFFCKFANALPGSNIYCSTLTISVMAIDRYYSVRSLNIPQPGAKMGSQCLRAVVISLLIWMLSLLLSFPLLVYYQVNMLYVFKDVYVFDGPSGDNSSAVVLRSYGWRQCRLSAGPEPGGADEHSNDPSDPSPSISWWAVDEAKIQLAMALMQAIMLYVVPLVVLSIFNMKLTRFLKMNAKKMNKGDVQRRESRVVLAPESQRCSLTVSSLPVHQVKTAISVAERRQNRTTALLIAMAGSYAVLWLPFTLVSVLIDLDWLGVESGSPIVERIDQFCKLLSISSICVNPFLYGFLNTNFRHEFNEIFSLCWRCVLLLGRNKSAANVTARSDRTTTQGRATTNTQLQYSAVVTSPPPDGGSTLTPASCALRR